MKNEKLEELYIQLEQASTVKEFNAIRDQINQAVIRCEQVECVQNRQSGRYSGVVMNTISVMR